jgi:hypothetical protein
MLLRGLYCQGWILWIFMSDNFVFQSHGQSIIPKPNSIFRPTIDKIHGFIAKAKLECQKDLYPCFMFNCKITRVTNSQNKLQLAKFVKHKELAGRFGKGLFFSKNAPFLRRRSHVTCFHEKWFLSRTAQKQVARYYWIVFQLGPWPKLDRATQKFALRVNGSMCQHFVSKALDFLDTVWRKSRSQSYDFWIYNYNASVVCSWIERFSK